MNVSVICPEYCFDLTGVSYIGNPKSNTVLYVSKKLEHLLMNLYDVNNCLVFIEENCIVPERLRKTNCIILTDRPGEKYAEFVKRLDNERFENDMRRSYTLCQGGYYIGDHVSIGENAYIEPGCLIGHDVIIGKNAKIMTGTKVKHAVIGDNFVANENAVIGSDSFTMAEDSHGIKVRIPSMGKVIIGDNVEIGACDNIVRGCNSDTVIGDHVKVDALVHIGHDAHIDSNTEITAGAVVGGFVRIDKNVFIGLNSELKNRVVLKENSYIGMGSNVIRNVESGKTVVGNPARVLRG